MDPTTYDPNTRLTQIQQADAEEWIAKARDMAIAGIGARPFSYVADEVQKRDQLDASEGAILAGHPGRGKTCAMAYVIDRVLRLLAPKYSPSCEFPFLFLSASQLWDAFHNATPPEPRVRWLFVDDWGMEYKEPFAMTRADEWFRIREACPGTHTFITTNLSMPQFKAQVGLERVVSRIQSMTDWINFTGPDRRKGWKT